MPDLTRRRTATRACALVVAAALAQGCATLTGTFELAGMHWSDGGSWKEVHPIHPERAVVGAVLVAPQGPHLTCYRTTEAQIVGFSARYDHQPLPSKEKLDTTTNLSLIYAYSDIPEKPKDLCPCPEPAPPPGAPSPEGEPSPTE